MEILSVTKGHVFLNEKCLWSSKGYYVGIKTGTHYSAAEHSHCPQLRAIVRSVDDENQTGMYHLYQDLQASPADSREENRADWKTQFIGCLVTVEASHLAGDSLTIYRCLELEEYFSANELEIFSPNN